MDMGHFFFTQPNPTDRISTWTHQINPPTQQPSKLQHRYSDSTWYIAICSFQPQIAYFQSFGGIIINSHKHTHTRPFNHPLSRTTRVSRYQKGKTNLDVTEARDSEWQWHPLGHMQVCTSLQTDNHASTSPLSFLQAGCPSCRPTNSVKALKAINSYKQ